MMDGDVSHNRVTRFLSERDYRLRDLWRQVKSTVCQIERRRRVDFRRHHPGEGLDGRKQGDVLAFRSLQWAFDAGSQLVECTSSRI